MRSINYKREMRKKAIAKKKNISIHIYGFNWYSVDGKYSKGKIHCSCPKCTFSKTFNLKSFNMAKIESRMSFEEA